MLDFKPVYNRLIEVAQMRRTTSYTDVAALLHLDAEIPGDRMEIGRILDEISCNENAQGRPLISAVVVLPEIGYPGKGFFLLARELGLNLYCDERSFFAYELKRVHDYWSSQPIKIHTPVYVGTPHHQPHVPVAVP